ncbi:MAG: esterase [Rhizobium sp.]|nr:esterase [Rhizobium sp.]
MARSDEPDYVFRDLHPERHDVYALYDQESERTRKETFCLLDLPYGAHPRMIFDLFPGGRHAPLAIFFHGGYWQSLDKQRFSFVARALLAKGFSVALPNYPLAPEARPGQIAEAATASIQAIVDAVSEHTGPPSSWLTTGHSAGGHLAVWAGLHARSHPAVAAVPFAGMAPVSGIFDLRPLVGTSLNRALGLTIRRAARLSPLDCDLPLVRYRIIAGAEETPGFLDQAAGFASRLRSTGREVVSSVLAGLNHYTILKDLLSLDSTIAGVLREMADVEERPCREAKR